MFEMFHILSKAQAVASVLAGYILQLSLFSDLHEQEI